jgi:DNA-binding MarR family transcriptional regulator
VTVATLIIANANVVNASAVDYPSAMSEQSKRRSADGNGTYKLTTSFPYLVRRVGVRIGELFDRRVAAFGVTVSMYRVLASLHEADGQQLGQLAEMTSIEMSTLSRLVGAMVRKGLVTRRRPERNGRIVEIALTAKGRTLVAQLLPIGAHFEAAAVAGLDAATVASLKAQLRIAYTNLDRLEEALAAGPGSADGTAPRALRGRAKAPRRPAAERAGGGASGGR